MCRSCLCRGSEKLSSMAAAPTQIMVREKQTRAACTKLTKREEAGLRRPVLYYVASECEEDVLLCTGCFGCVACTLMPPGPGCILCRKLKCGWPWGAPLAGLGLLVGGVAWAACCCGCAPVDKCIGGLRDSEDDDVCACPPFVHIAKAGDLD